MKRYVDMIVQYTEECFNSFGEGIGQNGNLAVMVSTYLSLYLYIIWKSCFYERSNGFSKCLKHTFPVRILATYAEISGEGNLKRMTQRQSFLFIRRDQKTFDAFENTVLKIYFEKMIDLFN